MLDFLKKLTDVSGLPGYERAVREILKAELEPHVDKLYSDRLGNLIAVKNENATGRHLAMCAHMDEVGLVVKGIDKDGLIRFESWGVDLRIIVAKAVKIGDASVLGVIGAKPIHKQKKEERDKAFTADELFIDIGVTTKEAAEKLVQPGNYVAFCSEFRRLGDHKIKAKALDDRAGCAVLVAVLKSDTKNKITAVFSAQEEVGTRGAAAAANGVFADLLLNVEGTICADTSGVEPHGRVTTQGEGPCISLVDRGSLYSKQYVDAITRVADENGIPWQYRRTGMGGTDAAMFHTAHTGTPAIGLAIPCRYIHSPVSVMDVRDFENAIKLALAFERAFGAGQV